MKKFILPLVLFLSVVVFSSCEDTTMEDQVDHSAIITSGDWNILFFFDNNGQQKGTDLRNYRYNFDAAGKIIASKSNVKNEGVWSLGEVSNKSKRLRMDFSSSGFEDLEREWVVKKFTNTQLELMRFGEDGSTIDLVFTKM